MNLQSTVINAITTGYTGTQLSSSIVLSENLMCSTAGCWTVNSRELLKSHGELGI